MEVSSLKLFKLSRAEFKEVLRKGKGIRLNFLVLKWLKNSDQKVKLGVLVSKKFAKKAVERNKVKRQIKEALRSFLPEFKERGVSLIFIPLPGLISDFKLLKAKIEKILKKEKII